MTSSTTDEAMPEAVPGAASGAAAEPAPADMRAAADAGEPPSQPVPKLRLEHVGKSFPVRARKRTAKDIAARGFAAKDGAAGRAPGRAAGRDAGSVTALEDIELSIAPGEFTVLVGPSGCGKSTLLDLLSGLAAPTSGRILLDGEPVTGPGLDRGIVFQGYALLPWRTALGNVEFGLEATGVPRRERTDRAREVLGLVGLRGFEDRHPHALSGGMRQRVAIARSLAYDPRVLLMDEPFAALDAQSRESLQDELLRIWERTGKTVVFITHSIDEAVLLGQRVAVLTSRPGRVKEVVPIDLGARTETEDLRSSTEFAEQRHRIWTLLHDEIDTAARRERELATA